MKRSTIALAVSMSSLALLPGCATMEQHGGKIIGTLSGAAAGALACDGDPRCIAAGAIAGIVLGELYDQRQAALREVAKEKQIALETQTLKTFNSKNENALEVSINEGAMFALGSDKLKPESREKLAAVAEVYRDKPQKILVIGHTDATGSETLNQALSERRARTVAQLFASKGVPESQVFFQGAGESQPIASNDTAEGREQNRRVEIVEIDSEESLAAYNLQRQNNTKYLTHSSRTEQEKKEILKRVSAAPVQSPKKKEPVVAEKPKAQAPSVREPRKSVAALVDFGGQPASSEFSEILLATGDTSDDEGLNFSLFQKAVADTPTELSPCFLDGPRKIGDIQNLKTGNKLAAADLKMSDYWPGLNGNVWLDTINGHMVAMQDLKVMRESGTPVGRPTVRIYQDINADKTADFTMQPHIESYSGENGLLLRSYFGNEGPVECIDVVMPNSGSKAAKAGIMYYAKGSGLYQQNITLKRIR